MINFTPLNLQYLSLLHKWLNQPHMRVFYQLEPISLQQVIDKYQNRINHVEPVICHIVGHFDQPFGFIQNYKNSDYPNYALEIQENGGISLDLFIGEPSYLHRGFGRQMLHQYIQTVVFNNYPDENQCYICHEINHDAAIKCSLAAGFTCVKDVIEDNKSCQLFVYNQIH